MSVGLVSFVQKVVVPHKQEAATTKQEKSDLFFYQPAFSCNKPFSTMLCAKTIYETIR